MLHINMTVVHLSEQCVLACILGLRVLWLGRSEEGHEELRCVLAVVRHGDRTPKQKMKMKITQVCIPCSKNVCYFLFIIRYFLFIESLKRRMTCCCVTGHT